MGHLQTYYTVTYQLQKEFSLAFIKSPAIPTLFKLDVSFRSIIFGYAMIISPTWESIAWATFFFATFVLLCVRFLVRYYIRNYQKKQKHFKKLLADCTAELEDGKDALESKSKKILWQNDQLERALSQLEKSDKMSSLGQLTAGIAHEINDPINFIHANIDTLDESIQDILKIIAPLDEIPPQNQSDIVREIQKNKIDYQFDLLVQELKQLVHGIREGSLRTTQITQGLRYYSRSGDDLPSNTDIHENIDTTLTLLQHRFKGRVKIIKKYQALQAIVAYPSKLSQVFMNVLSNALDAIEGRGIITILTQDLEQDRVKVSILDTGTGISEDTQKRMYEPFFTTKTPGQGSGLGLTIVRSIVEKHQGEIHIKSTKGNGTRFDIILPCSPV